MEKVAERFIEYARIDTQSDEASKSCPSTEKQLNLARLLVREMKDMGLADAAIDNNGYVSATLPSNCDTELPVVGFIAHLDTSPDMSGDGVDPLIVNGYDGGDIVLNREENVVLSPSDFPILNNYTGQTLITTRGKTLLGADNKAGIAEILTAVEFFLSNPEVKHGTIRIGFTPDEEIGRGADRFDVAGFGADFAYTIDGGQLGELEFENFNAAIATISFLGRNVHPGTAKDQMISSMYLATEYLHMLPEKDRPEHTEGYEGFFHLIDFTGTVEESEVRLLVRDHERASFEKRKRMITEAAESINKRFREKRVAVEIRDQYYNMKEKVEPHMHIIELAKAAMTDCGVEPLIKPIRGGTDGARLSFMGLPCPNIFTGGHNFHGKYEFIPVESMVKAVETIKRIITLVPERYKKTK